MKALRALHAWAGLFAAILFIPLGLSGALLVWGEDMMRAGNAPAQQIAPARTIEQRAADLAAIERAVAPNTVQWVRLPRERIGLYEAGLGQERVAVVDPVSLEMIELREGHARFIDYLFEFHIGLFADEAGEKVQGVLALFGIGFAISGVILFWPARRSFSLAAMAPRDASRRSLLSAHRAIGIVAAAPLALTMLGAVLLGFGDDARKALAAAMPSKPEAIIALPRGEPGWAGALATLQIALPDAQLKVIQYPAPGKSEARFRLRRPMEWQPNGRTYATIDLSTGALTSLTDSEKRPLGERLFYLAYPLHAGMTGGWAMKLLQTFVGLALAGLGVLGVWGFLKRRRV